MRRALGTAMVVAALTAVGCGGDDGPSEAAATTQRRLVTVPTVVTTSTTRLEQVYDAATLLGTPCLGEEPNRLLRRYSTDATEDGVRALCAGGVWKQLEDVGDGCGGTSGEGPWATAEGIELACVDEQLHVPGTPRTSFYAGTYEVGTSTAQVPPGTYVASDVGEGCYWERLNRDGGTIDNGVTLGAPRFAFTIQPTDFAITVTGPCGEWRRE